MLQPGQSLSALCRADRSSKTNAVRRLSSLLPGILGAARHRSGGGTGRIGWDYRAKWRRQDNSVAAAMRYYTADLRGTQRGGTDRSDPSPRRSLRLGNDGPPERADR